VYLTPKTGDTLHPPENQDLLQRLVLEPAVMQRAVKADEVVIYSLVGDHLRNVTSRWESSSETGSGEPEPRRVEVGNPLYAFLLGPEWLPLESGFRWMPRRATVRLGGPGSVNDRLLLEGFCPGGELNAGPLHLNVAVDGIPSGVAEIFEPGGQFRRLLSLPSALTGRRMIEVELAVDRVLKEPDGRDLGLVFGTIAIQP